MTCPDENTLLELADGLLSEARRPSVSAHVETCERCRRVLEGLSSDEVKPSRPQNLAPRSMLAQQLASEAPQREALAIKFGLTVFICGLFLDVGIWRVAREEPFPWPVVAVLAVVAPYQLVALALIARGRFHPAMTWLNSIFETSAPFVMIAGFGWRMGEAVALVAPLWVIWGAVVVFSALRASPALSLVVGACAALEGMALYTMFRDQVPPAVSQVPYTFTGALLRSVFLLTGGIAAAVLAIVQLRRADAALTAIRQRDLLGRYILHERLGRGGMAEVFRATLCPEGGFVKTVAVKRVLAQLAQNPRFVEAFREEARLCAQLTHPNIVQVFDFGRYRDEWILVMEFVEGVSLQALLEARGEPLPVPLSLYIATELLEALDYIHHKRGADGAPLSLVHRDLNPPNVLISRAGEVKLSDFGVAKASDRQAVAAEGAFVGKTAWAPPEQRAGLALDGRADLFNMGLLLEWLLRGKPLPEGLDSLLVRLKAEDANDRPSSAEQVRAELIRLAGPSLAEASQALRQVVAEVRSPARPQDAKTATGAATTIAEGSRRLAT